MKVTIIGTGYVGLSTGVCFAELGHQVTCFDIDEQKIQTLSEGKATMFEPGLEELLTKNLASNHLKFTTNPQQAIAGAELIFIAVGTPELADGSADLSQVMSAARLIAEHIKDYAVIINKSTVPMGTAETVRTCIVDQLKQLNKSIEFDMASNPEFLRQGSAIQDSLNPDRIVIGVNSQRAGDILTEFYQHHNIPEGHFILVDIASAELSKYASNAFLATKISFINMISCLAKTYGADTQQISKIMGLDERIAPHFLNPGCGYGGLCFPKDVSALIKMAESKQVPNDLLVATEAINQHMKHIILQWVAEHYSNDIQGKTFTVWGLSFKPDTNDMREATSQVVLPGLWAMGANIQAYDPEAMDEAKRLYPDQRGLVLCDTAEQALEGADGLIILTEWDQFHHPDFDVLKSTLKDKVIFDGRNLYNRSQLIEIGLDYYSVTS